MYRSMMQVNVKGSDKAIEFYKKAFDAKVLCNYPNSDGTLYHAELDVYGQVLALTELTDDSTVTGNTMQFCLHLGQGKEETVQKIYDVLKDGAEIHYPISPCDWSSLMVGLIDKYGVNWCIFA